ncbi:MAG: ScyD/ScyE family protein [Nocardioidaceae bacterium]
MASLVAIGTAAAVTAVPSTSVAAAGGVGVVTRHLDGPFGLQKAVKHRGFVVAEADSGQVTRVFKDGRKRAILNGAPGVAGVAASPSRVFAVIGGPNEKGQPSGGRYGSAKVLRMDYRGGHVKVIADLMAYELKHNPDGQVQFVNGKPVDALSNPFSMTWSRRGLFVADGGANDVLKVDPRTGRVSTFFVPPTVKDVKACRGPHANSNPGTKGCDSVPTGVQVLGGSVYVSTLGGEAPGAGRVYKVDARTGTVQRVWKGFTAPTGIAVRADGTMYLSEVMYGAPAGQPPAGFDPASVGRITRISHGHVSHASVTMPTGLVLKNGDLYASAWSIGSFLGLKHAGQVVKVADGAFK